MTLSTMTLNLTALNISALDTVMLSAVYAEFFIVTQCHHAGCRYAECPGTVNKLVCLLV
jgi:hypothetical protein